MPVPAVLLVFDVDVLPAKHPVQLVPALPLLPEHLHSVHCAFIAGWRYRP